MKSGAAKWVVAYGVFLVAMGALGYASNPEKAKTALLSGGMFGGLSVLWGILMWRGFGWSRFAALGTTLLLVVAFGWRSWAGWNAVAAGEPKAFAASLISAMLVASIGLVPLIVKDIASTNAKRAASDGSAGVPAEKVAEPRSADD